jgi:uncharacterized coiled-coil DUF342 family protein
MSRQFGKIGRGLSMRLAKRALVALGIAFSYVAVARAQECEGLQEYPKNVRYVLNFLDRAASTKNFVSLDSQTDWNRLLAIVVSLQNSYQCMKQKSEKALNVCVKASEQISDDLEKIRKEQEMVSGQLSDLQQNIEKTTASTSASQEDMKQLTARISQLNSEIVSLNKRIHEAHLALLVPIYGIVKTVELKNDDVIAKRRELEAELEVKTNQLIDWPFRYSNLAKQQKEMEAQKLNFEVKRNELNNRRNTVHLKLGEVRKQISGLHDARLYWLKLESALREASDDLDEQILYNSARDLDRPILGQTFTIRQTIKVLLNSVSSGWWGQALSQACSAY